MNGFTHSLAGYWKLTAMRHSNDRQLARVYGPTTCKLEVER